MPDRKKLKEELLKLIKFNRSRVPDDVLARAEMLALEQLSAKQQKGEAFEDLKNDIQGSASTQDSGDDLGANTINMRNFPKIRIDDLVEPVATDGPAVDKKDPTSLIDDNDYILKDGVEVVKYNRKAAKDIISTFLKDHDEEGEFVKKLHSHLQKTDH